MPLDNLHAVTEKPLRAVPSRRRYRRPVNFRRGRPTRLKGTQS